MPLLDRFDERKALDRVLAAARDGLSAALVLRGEPGIGKTSLLEYGIDSGADFQVARIAGIESEMELGFAGLHRLLIPFLPGLHKLPRPQRDAVGSAFGLVDGPPADRFMAGLATLSLLADAATDRPLLCVIDDAQWLDQESLDALALVGRRLYADRIALLFGARDVHDGRVLLAGIPDIHVGGLPVDHALELLASVAEGRLDHDVATRIAIDTQGSPMAIIELVGELSADELSRRGLLPEPLPLSRRLEAHFLRQVRELPADTQTLLLVAAAEPSGDPRVVTDAAARLGISPDAAEPARAEGVFEMRPEVRFRHPLIRSAVYGGAPSRDRRSAHEALSRVTDRERDPDRRAWHRAAATTGTDDEVADELADAAGRARARGGYTAAGTFLARSADLTHEGGRRADRVLAAAEAHLAGGAPARARRLLENAAAHLDVPLQRAMAQRLHGAIRYALGEAHGTASVLMDAAKAIEPFDVHFARATLLEAMSAARVTGQFTAPGESELDVGFAARAMQLPPGSEPTVADLLLDGSVATFVDGHGAAVDAQRLAIAALQVHEVTTNDDLQWLGTGCWAAGALGDDEALHALATRLVDNARQQGALVWLSIGLMFLAMSELLDGSVDAAGAHFAERAQIMTAIGRPSDVGELVIAAWRGNEAECRAEAAAVARYATEHAHGWMSIFVDYALAVLELGLGNYEAAYASSTKDYQANPFLSIVSFPNLIEAAVRCGERAAAIAALDDYATHALANGTPISLGLLTRSRALLADADDAENLYEEAIEHFRHCRGALQRARTQLVYGEWLRRQNRRVDAREQLRAAHQSFVTMGADGLAERARVELAATGERARKRTVDTTNDLTPQEAQIAMLAAQSATNPEIAAKLFLSANTVDYHLRKVYRKLGVTSRRQLGRALPA